MKKKQAPEKEVISGLSKYNSVSIFKPASREYWVPKALWGLVPVEYLIVTGNLGYKLRETTGCT